MLIFVYYVVDIINVRVIRIIMATIKLNDNSLVELRNSINNYLVTIFPNDIVKIIIAAAGSGISVQVFGACVPSPCVWGSVPGFAYAANVSSGAAVAFSAQYKFSFAQISVVGHLQGHHLEVETFTEFTDGSGRSNLYTTDQMAK